jgi:hypothetical protein
MTTSIDGFGGVWSDDRSVRLSTRSPSASSPELAATELGNVP